MSNKITTLLFDLDGTLIDTNELIIQSFLHTMEKYYPGQYQREDVLPFIGPTLMQTFGSLNMDKAEEMIRVYREFNHAQHDYYTKEFAGVYETIKTLHEKGFKLGIVTAKILETSRRGLKLSRLEPFFDTIIALDHTTKPKPDPQPVLKALDTLGSSPEEAIMVGDNYHDILAGKNAGTKTAGVSWSIKGKDFLLEYSPDYMLEKMDDLLSIVGVREG